MQTILGANGQIARELAKELKRNYTSDIRLASRNPKKVNDTDSLFPANLLDVEQTEKAVKGSEIAYLTVGLPMNTVMWKEQFPPMMRHVIDACKKYNCRLVFFDNTYMYPQDGCILTEETSFDPVGRKGKVRAGIANMLLNEMRLKRIDAVICRAPEFYGPGKTQSITNSMIFNAIRKNKKPRVFLKDDTLRTLIWTPDASRAMALIGNNSDTYGQTWHLPADDNRLTYRQFMALISEIYNQDFDYDIVSSFQVKLGGIFKKSLREVQELLPRYAHDNIFSSVKFRQRFPDFDITTLKEGVMQIMQESRKS